LLCFPAYSEFRWKLGFGSPIKEDESEGSDEGDDGNNVRVTEQVSDVDRESDENTWGEDRVQRCGPESIMFCLTGIPRLTMNI